VSSHGKHAHSASRSETKRDADEDDSLTGKASRAFGWSFASNLLTRVATMGTGIVLARILGPHAFGAYAVALVALFAMQMFNELGVSLAIVRWEDDPHDITPTVTTISVFVSSLAYIACFFGAPAYASAMGDPSASGVVRFLALAILIDGFCTSASGLLERAFQQKRKMFATQVSGWLGTALTLILALSGRGVMSLAIGQVFGAALCMIIMVASVPSSMRFGFNRIKARALLGFGLPLAGSNLVNFAVSNTDQIIVGHLLGTSSLGYYVLALNMAGWPLSVISQPLRSVLPATFSRLQHDRAVMRDTFLTSLALLGAVALPACLVICGSARPLIGFVYGTRWLPAARPLLWLALLSCFRILFELAYDYMIVLMFSRAVLVIQLIWMLFLVPGLIIGVKLSGIYGAGAAEAAVAIIAVLPCYLHCLRSAGVGLNALGKRLALPALVAVALWVFAAEVARVEGNYFIALVLSGFVTLVAVGVLVYRLRSTVSLLRAPRAIEDQPLAESAEGADMAAPVNERVTEPFGDDLAAELAEVWGVVKIPPSVRGPWRNSDTSRQRAFAASRTSFHDVTGPIPVYKEFPDFAPGHPLEITSPLYRMTAASRQWDPGAGGTARRSYPVPGRGQRPGDRPAPARPQGSAMPPLPQADRRNGYPVPGRGQRPVSDARQLRRAQDRGQQATPPPSVVAPAFHPDRFFTNRLGETAACDLDRRGTEQISALQYGRYQRPGQSIEEEPEAIRIEQDRRQNP
jgi:O-antigen/teichoic acid export membrane protein